MNSSKRARIAALSCASIALVGLAMTVYTQGNAPTVLRATREIGSDQEELIAIARNPTADSILLRSSAGRITTDGRSTVPRAPAVGVLPRSGRGTFAVAANGNLVVLDGNQLRILEGNGREIRSFAVPSAQSLTILRSGDIALATAAGDTLIQLWTPLGARRAAFGSQLQLTEDTEWNRSLNRGFVLSARDGDIYYVFAYAPDPVVRRYTPAGDLVSEFPIAGTAIEMQSSHANRLIENGRPVVGGVVVVRSATVDPNTGHLLISAHGGTGIPPLLEIDSKGHHVRSYGLQDTTGQSIFSIDDLAVTSKELVVLSAGRAFAFTLATSATDDLAKRTREKKGLVEAVWSLLERVGAIGSARADEGCPSYINPSCSCPCGVGGSLDCATALGGSGVDMQRVIQKTCTVASQQYCDLSVQVCTTGGVITTHGVNLGCTDPDRDGDGYTPGMGDCNDLPGGQNAYPGAPTNCSENEDLNCNDRPDSEDCGTSPVAFDLASNGFHLTDLAGGVSFDITADGEPESLAWTRAWTDDAWLALDRNHNNAIDDGAELFGSFTPQPPSAMPNGFIALAEYDRPERGGNNDGNISRADSIFQELVLWRDLNHDGRSAPVELQRLASSPIEWISLNARESRRVDEYGNEFRLRVRVHGTGVGPWGYDIWLLSGR